MSRIEKKVINLSKERLKRLRQYEQYQDELETVKTHGIEKEPIAKVVMFIELSVEEFYNLYLDWLVDQGAKK